MRLSLFYHVYKNTNNLEKSLNSIANQTDKDFEFILINDGCSSVVLNILKKYDFSSMCKTFKYIFISENHGHSFSFNEALRYSNAEYVYYFGGNISLMPNFIKKINSILDTENNLDVISFAHVPTNEKKITKFISLNSDLKYNIAPSLRDKIFSRSFLNRNSITLNENGYFPLEFLYKVMMNFDQWVLIKEKIIDYSYNSNFTYNLYDIFQMNNLLIKNYSNTSFWKKNIELIQFLMILYVTRIFLSRIFLVYEDRNTRKGAINFAKNWLSSNIPNWKTNKILNSKKTDLSNESRERILNIFDWKLFSKNLGNL